MYTAFSSNRKDHRLTINTKKVNGKYQYKKITKFYLEYIHHQMIQDVLDFNQCESLSDFVLTNQKLKSGSLTTIARKYDVNTDNISRTFKKGFRLERMKLRNMGIELPINQTSLWSRA